MYLGIDVGTTKIAAVVLHAETGDLVASASQPNASRLPAPPAHSVWDARRAVDIATETARAALAMLGRSDLVRGIGVTGQMHGVVLVGPDLEPLLPFVGWQDKRCDGPLAGFPSAIAWMRQLAGSEALSRSGCHLASGYLGATLFWLARTGALPGGPATAAFLPDYLVARLCDQPAVTDPTNAASSGIFDVADRRWNADLIAALDLPANLLPTVRPTGAIVGQLAATPAKVLGLPAGLPVVNALGDNQASFLGSVGNPTRDLLVNVGTGGQISATIGRFIDPGLLETRPFVGAANLVVGAGHVGGNAYALLRDFIREVGQACFGVTEPTDLYPVLNRLAASVPPGSDGLRCDPRFAGTRSDPAIRGSFTGLGVVNFTPGHLTRSLFEGVGATFRMLYDEMIAVGLAPRRRLVGSGNGIRRNPLLAAILAESFGMPLVTPRHTEEAAYGAALLAAVATGAIPSLEAAGQLIRYEGEPTTA